VRGQVEQRDLGAICLFAVLLDAFQTIILPRRATGRFRLTRLFLHRHLAAVGFSHQLASRPAQA
jgi:hypothetical protein